MKIYTRAGDDGGTALFGGGRVEKSHPRVEAYGTVDELNSQVGVAILHVVMGELADRLRVVQHDLFALGASLATPPPDGVRRRPETPPVPVDRIEAMERWIDDAEEVVEPLEEFILPGGSAGAAQLHLCRTVCRRAERAVVELAREDHVEDGVVRYLNRLSDLLFSMAREENAHAGERDVTWKKDGR